jgi:hypothetical protein
MAPPYLGMNMDLSGMKLVLHFILPKLCIFQGLCKHLLVGTTGVLKSKTQLRGSIHGSKSRLVISVYPETAAIAQSCLDHVPLKRPPCKTFFLIWKLATRHSSAVRAGAIPYAREYNQSNMHTRGVANRADNKAKPLLVYVRSSLGQLDVKIMWHWRPQHLEQTPDRLQVTRVDDEVSTKAFQDLPECPAVTLSAQLAECCSQGQGCAQNEVRTTCFLAARRKN